MDFLIILSFPDPGISRSRSGLVKLITRLVKARDRNWTIVKQTKLESVETTPFLQSVTVHFRF